MNLLYVSGPGQLIQGRLQTLRLPGRMGYGAE